jgi:predicted hotdog family 3-hydroxylacyl-ACP dehydratase
MGVFGAMSQVREERGTVDFGLLAQQRDATAHTADGPPELQSVLSMAELTRRPSRFPDHASERPQPPGG